MSDLYFVIAPNEEYGVAKPLIDRGEYRAFTFLLMDPGELADYPVLRFQSALGDPPDVVWGSRQTRLVSELVRTVYTEHGGPRDRIQWLEAEVVDAGGAAHGYWIPHFPVRESVYDTGTTEFGPGGVPMLWVLDTEKIQGLHVFVPPELGGITVIHETVGSALAESGATGYVSDPARVN